MIVLDAFEHITYVSTTYSEEGIHSVKLKTNCNKEMKIESSEGPGEHKKTLKLKQQNKAVVGFKGAIDGAEIMELYVLVAERLDSLMFAKL